MFGIRYFFFFRILVCIRFGIYGFGYFISIVQLQFLEVSFGYKVGYYGLGLQRFWSSEEIVFRVVFYIIECLLFGIRFGLGYVFSVIC